MAMTSAALRKWLWVHKWSSLVCTVFMLLLCLTGLPLIFYHEILEVTGNHVTAPKMPEGTPKANLDAVLAAAQAQYPGWSGRFLSKEEDDDSFWYVTLGETPSSDPAKNKLVAVDSRTAKTLPTPRFDEGFMYVMFKLHVDLFAGLPGTLFLGFMGLLLVVAIVTGVVVYGPFMRKLEFGTVRREKARTKWLDLHNLLGIVTLAWFLVVGLTGVINTLGEPLIKLWQFDQMGHVLAPYKGLEAPKIAGSVEKAVGAAVAAKPGMNLSFVAFPGGDFSTPHHFVVFMRGKTPLTSKLSEPVVVDSQTGAVTATPTFPWYITALLISQPLHFGNYGGMPMKILWALLDVATIVVLGSGLYLWLRKRRTKEQPIDELTAEPAS